MNRVTYVRLGPNNIITESGQTDEPAFDALAPTGLTKIPLISPPPVGWRWDRKSKIATPLQEASDAE